MTTIQTIQTTFLLLLLTTSIIIICQGREITATNEWQLIGENDTIPAGLHVKMDLSTGEKWARIVQDDNENDDRDDLQMNDNNNNNDGGALISIPDNEEEDEPSNTNDDTIIQQQEEDESFKPKRDYEMMHRVMSSLPPEELDRFGGLPQLPTPKQHHHSNSKEATISISSPEERLQFERKMEELWTLRQEELRKFQEEHVANVPSLLKERIEVLRRYIDGPWEGRVMVLNKRNDEEEQQQQQQQQLDDEDDDSDDTATTTTANDVISCLKDLEYQLSDIDHARDFHTLGGWPYLVALLYEPIHKIDDNGCQKDNNDERRSTIMDEDDGSILLAHTTLMYEIQSLTAMTIGTAVGNLGEFHGWALEDVSNVMIRNDINLENSYGDCSHGKNTNDNLLWKKGEPISALFSLVRSFDVEFNATIAGIGSSIDSSNGSSESTTTATKTTTSSQTSALEMFRTSKLRAAYALGSLLRGNPLAQQQFVSKNGPHVLVRYALNALSSTTATGGVVTKSDYKLASKVLALGEDIVMNILLQEEDYKDNDDTQNDIAGNSNSNRMIQALTTEPWCELSLKMLSPPISLVGESFARSTKERALSAIRALGPACRVNHQLQCANTGSSTEGGNDNQECTTEESSSWGVSEILKVKSEWNREGSGDGLDSVYRRELLDLIDGVLEALQ
eukprot:scaffold66649_cov36-Cyclotella_meneghiniana.AAC.2